MKEQLRHRTAHAVGHGAASGLRAAEIDRQQQQIAVQPAGQARRSGVHRELVFDRLVYGFIPTACRKLERRKTVRPLLAPIWRRFTIGTSFRTTPILAVVGDLTAEEAFDVSRACSATGSDGRAEQKFIAPPQPRAASSLSTSPFGQTEIRVGHLGVKRIRPIMPLDLALRIWRRGAIVCIRCCARSAAYVRRAGQMDTLKEAATSAETTPHPRQPARSCG